MSDQLTLTIPVGETWAFQTPIHVELVRNGNVVAEIDGPSGNVPLYLTGIPGHTVRVPLSASYAPRD